MGRDLEVLSSPAVRAPHLHTLAEQSLSIHSLTSVVVDSVVHGGKGHRWFSPFPTGLGWTEYIIPPPMPPHTHPELILGLLSGVCGAVRENVHGGGRLCRGE